MKFIDIIKEDEQSEFDKVFKRTKTIFKAYRKGRIRTKSGIVFSYELPEDSHISVAGGRLLDPTGLIICEKIKIKQESEECIGVRYGLFGEAIKKKFNDFDIDFIFNVFPEDITFWIREGLSEDFHIGEDLTDSEIKKAKLIFNLYKEGKVKYNDSIYKYVLTDENVQITKKQGDLIINPIGNMYSQISIYKDMQDGHLKYLPYDLYNGINVGVRMMLIRKFGKHNIILSI